MTAWRGKEYNTYQATQRQRQLETSMRAQRERVQLLREGGADPDDITIAQCKYQAILEEYRAFSSKMKLPTQMERVYTGRTPGRISPSSQTYAEWQAEQINKAKERVEKHRRQDMGATSTMTTTRTMMKNVHFKTGGVDLKEYAEQKRLAEAVKENFNPLEPNKVVQTLRREAYDWIATLTEKEKQAISKYAYNSIDPKYDKFYARLNAMLRGDVEENIKLREYAETISEALGKNKSKHNVIAYRRADHDPSNGSAVGEVFVPRQFLSSSVTSAGQLNQGDLQIIMYVRSGAKAAYIEELSPFKKQRELLVDKNCLCRVISRQGNNIEIEILK